MFVRVVLSCLVASACASPAASLRIGNWNVANHPNNSDDRQQLGTILGYASPGRPIDLLTLSETDTASAPDTASVFGSVYGGTYASVVAPADGGGDRTGFVYNTASLSLVATGTVGVGTLTHPTLRARFRPTGTNGANDFYVYATHLQSGSAAQNKSVRVNEAGLLRADANTLGFAHVIVAGDFNWQKADDVSAGVGAYRTFAAAGSGRVVDPVNRVGDWRNNPLFKDVLTEDPDQNLSDRFDMQLTSGELLDGRGLDFTPGTYRVVGNEGTIAPGGVITASATLPMSVVTALGAFSDHLPVLADYDFTANVLAGDLDYDGGVSIVDFNAFAANFGKPVGQAWADGDFDNDGGVSIGDFNLLAANFGKSVAVPAASPDYTPLLAFAAAHDGLPVFEAVTGVPEPSAFGLLAIGMIVAVRRRY